MNNVKRDLQESVVLHNLLISILPKMVKRNDKEMYTFVRDFTREKTSLASDFICKEVRINLLKEVFTLINQTWANDLRRFDEGLSNEKNILKIIKSQISTGPKPIPLNNRELYKRIREAMVHNNQINPNFVYNLTNFELNLGKVNGTDYIVQLTPQQIFDLIYVLKNNTTGNKVYGSIHIANTNTITTRNEIKDNIKILDDNGCPNIDLDNNQVERIYNYFRYGKNNMDIIGNESQIKKAMRFPHDQEALFAEKLTALMIISSIDSGTTWKDLTKQFPQLLDMAYFSNFYFAIISNLLFTVAATQNNAELETMLSGCIPNITSENVRHIRNSLCHGRYFHDFNKTFYFYDGKKTLDFKFKLTIENINKLLDKIAKGSYSVTMLN